MTPETALKKAVRDYLKLKGWFVFPIMQGLGSYPGISDMIALKDCRTVFIELKAPNGRQSEKQKVFQENIECQGGEYYLVRSLDEIEQALK